MREDYSPNGTAWDYLPHDHARSRAYRWGEDGLLGISDNHQRLCFALALWNGRDPILKERLFGLSGNEGNHGEDVKEYYFYLDSTPTHSYMKALYKYPQAEYPYARARRGEPAPGAGRARVRADRHGRLRRRPLLGRQVEYAKAGVDDILVRVSRDQPGPGGGHAPPRARPSGSATPGPGTWAPSGRGWPRARAEDGHVAVEAEHPTLGTRRLFCEGAPRLLFTENETNHERLFGVPNATPYVKDGIGEAVVGGRADAVNPAEVGTKAARALSASTSPPAATRAPAPPARAPAGAAGRTRSAPASTPPFAPRRRRPTSSTAPSLPAERSEDCRRVMRQAAAGLLWSKQFYHYDVRRWLAGDPTQPAPPPTRRARPQPRVGAPLQRRRDLHAGQVGVSLVRGLGPRLPHDPARPARSRLRQVPAVLFLREWYMHPNGQIPAYEWALGDVNPPVHAWAAWRVYKIDRSGQRGRGDRQFLERVFHKLLLNFTWWVNRKDAEGKNVFQGGFLGLDNIGVFDRSAPLPTGGHIEQSDGTSWMGMYSLNMLAIALELAQEDPAYEDVASKFFEHFMLHRPRHAQPGRRRRHQPLERGGRLLLRRAPRRRAARPCPCGCAPWWG